MPPPSALAGGDEQGGAPVWSALVDVKPFRQLNQHHALVAKCSGLVQLCRRASRRRHVDTKRPWSKDITVLCREQPLPWTGRACGRNFFPCFASSPSPSWARPTNAKRQRETGEQALALLALSLSWRIWDWHCQSGARCANH